MLFYRENQNTCLVACISKLNKQQMEHGDLSIVLLWKYRNDLCQKILYLTAY